MAHKEVAEEFKKTERDLLQFIKLIMSSKTKEEMQIDTMKYLSANTDICKKYLREMSGEGDNNSTPINTSQSDPNQVELKQDHDEASVGNLKQNNTLDSTETPRSDTSIGDKTTSTRQNQRSYSKIGNSKYAKYGKDFSNLSREPNKTKKKSTRQKKVKDITVHFGNDKDIDGPRKQHSHKATTKESEDVTVRERRMSSSMIYADEKDQSQNYEMTNDKSNGNKIQITSSSRNEIIESEITPIDVIEASNDAYDENKALVSVLINTLIYPNNKREQDTVLDLLRHNDALKQTFLERASSLRNLKIPIFPDDSGKPQMSLNSKDDEILRDSKTIGYTEQPETSVMAHYGISAPNELVYEGFNDPTKLKQNLFGITAYSSFSTTVKEQQNTIPKHANKSRMPQNETDTMDINRFCFETTSEAHSNSFLQLLKNGQDDDNLSSQPLLTESEENSILESNNILSLNNNELFSQDFLSSS